MNKHFYRVIFNKALGLWQCVSELAKTAGKSKSLKAVVVATTLVMSANVMAYDVTYNDGKTHSAGEFTYVQGFMHITEPNTKISAEKQVIFGSTPESTGIPNNNVLISNQAEATSQDIIIGAKNPSKVQLDNATITAYNTLVIGGNAQAELTASNASTITVNNMTVLSDQANGKSTFTLTDKDTTLSTQTLHVGVSDVANMTIKNKAHVRTDNVTISALQAGTGSSMTMDNGSMQVNDTMRVGMNGTGTLDILNGGLIQGNKMSIGDKENAVGIVNISKTNHDNESKSSLILSEVLRIGNSGTGHINLSNGEISSPEIVIGWDTNSKGSLTITDNDRVNQTVSLSTNDLIIGYQGQGEMSIQNLSYNDYVGTLGNAKRVTLGDKVGSHGTLTIKEAGLFIQPREQNTSYLTIGNEGTGVLNLLEQGDIDVTQIRREKTGQAIVNINGGQITVRQDQNNLFENFDETTPINIGENGVIFHTGEVTDNYVIVNNNTVTINKNAILTGNTGSLNFDKTFIDGSFIKKGVGTLILDENNKKFTGDLSIFHGLLKINGNYTMNGENLTIGIIDQNDNQSINTTDEYGKLEVTGTADISSGHLQVLADDIAKILITKDNPTEEFKDIVKAGTLKGRFKDVKVFDATGNSITTTLTADYRDEKDGRVHLSFNPQNPSTGNPSTGNPSTGNPSTGNPSTGNPSLPSSVSTFTNAVKSQNNTSAENIAKVLDNSIATPTNLLGNTLKLTTSRLTQAELSQYANELQPLMLGTTGQLFNQHQAIFAQAVQEQTLSPSRHLWAKAIIRDGELQSSSHVNGYDDRHYGAIIGADTAVTSKLNLGVALAYVDSQAKTHNIQQKMTSDHIQGLIYGNYQAGENTLLNFHAGIGQVDIHGERHINVPRLDALTTAQSNYKANTTQAGIGVQHRIGSEKQYVEPFAQFDYRQVSSKAYQETGSNMFNLNVDKQRHEALRWTLGMRANQPLAQNLALTGFISASIEQADNPTVQASFNQFSNEKFATTGQKLGQEIGSAGVGLRYYPSKMTEVSAIYQGEWRKYYKQQGGLLEFKMKF